MKNFRKIGVVLGEYRCGAVITVCTSTLLRIVPLLAAG
jgi:hypothetical protein